ncbi:MAG: 1,4-dihydroxy-2-naphthoate octaprenyltransferase [Bacteroidales bacterium]|nr:1,4-dihydroxy-2-naphthoate octaprenyltransferase [Bacteroidales bacterium]
MIASIKKWFYAARPYSFFVSMATVIMPIAIAFSEGHVKWLPAILCLIFAVLAQATSNLVNDYADFKTGSDNENSLGKDRKLVSGEISPKEMLRAITISATLCLLAGLPLIYWGGWILLPFGLIIIAAAFCYSLGPVPLSYNALGDVAVILFFGIVPVTFTYFILTKSINLEIMTAGLAMGLVVDELLIVNNIRDEEEDKLHDKVTTVGLFGKKFMMTVFLLNPLIASALGFYFLKDICDYKVWAVAMIPMIVYSLNLFKKLRTFQGKQLNALLGKASFEAIIFAAIVVVATCF